MTKVPFSDWMTWIEAIPYIIVAFFALTIMALVIVAALSSHCAVTWRWLKYKACGKRSHEIEESQIPTNNANQASVQISHSLPDLQVETIQPILQEIKETVTKKVHQKFVTRNSVSVT